MASPRLFQRPGSEFDASAYEPAYDRLMRCPSCGTDCPEGDTFCEADGTPLSGPSAPGAACGGCGAIHSDFGDGYCTTCGARLDAADAPTDRPPPPLSPGMWVGRFRLVRSDDDRLLVTTAEGVEALLVLGPATALEAEAEAIQRVACDAFPRVLGREADAVRGDLLALAAPRAGAVPLAEAAAGLSIDAAFDFLGRFLDVLARVEARGFAISPRQGDVLVGPGGAVVLARARGARRLPPGAQIDARSLLGDVGNALVPRPAVRGPVELLRLLCPSRVAGDDPRRSIEIVRAELATARAAADRVSLPPARVGEACDAGFWRAHNQDATATASGELGGEPWSVLVVCDGVSSSSTSAPAATGAARTTRDVLAHFVRSGDAAFEALSGAMASAIRAAHLAICAGELDNDDDEDLAGTTLVAALIYRGRLTIGWVGDSRAYLVTDRGAQLLTRDHSWVNEVVASGEMTEAEALRSPHAHTITRCLGPLEVEGNFSEAEPEVRTLDLTGPGLLVLCSDGLWNYTQDAGVLGAAARDATSLSPPEVARHLVNYALARGGQDNVSVAVSTLP